ncbi:MAG: divergent polysaccharide deacetylase family protein [Proteobacteria bacterium]|nr:divergent polysaccharide deacetylase family protein [Pseudomonadota bacterium]
MPLLKPLKMVEVPPEEPEPEDKVISGLPTLAIIIDDIGNNARFKELIGIGVPLTLAVMPFTPYAKEAAISGSSSGLEIILHLPMEPRRYPANNPGKGALLTIMDKSTLINQLKADLEAVPNITGVNNHMGSKFTEYADGMHHVLGELKKRGLFFIDSKTSTKSVALYHARAMGIKTAERSIFLDNNQAEDAIVKQLDKAIEAAKTKGRAIAIGHPYRETVKVLKNILPTIEGKGVRLVTASEIVN